MHLVARQGERLFVLRRGCLFHVSLDESLRVLDAVEVVRVPLSEQRFDQVLVEGASVVVLTLLPEELEVRRFEVDSEGRLSPRPTLRLETLDRLVADWLWYREAPLRRRYAARLVNGQLDLYLTTPLRRVNGRVWVPRVGLNALAPAIEPTALRRSPEGLEGRALHFRLRCSVLAREPTCVSAGVLGARVRLVVEGDSDWFVLVTAAHERDEQGELELAGILRLPFGVAPPALLRLDVVRTQLASGEFLPTVDMAATPTHLNVLLRRPGEPATTIHMPLARLVGVVEPKDDETEHLPQPVGDLVTIVGNSLLYPRGAEERGLYLHRFDNGEEHVIELEQRVAAFRRILGSQSVLIGGRDGEAVVLPAPDALPTRQLAFHHLSYVSGPVRGSETLALVPVEPSRSPWAEVEVLAAEGDALRSLGTIAGDSPLTSDGCLGFCPHWFVNAQAFLREDEIIAVLGYEIVRARVADGRLVEEARIDLLSHLGG